MTKETEHIEWIEKYLKDTNLKPFKMVVSDSLLHINEWDVERFAREPKDNFVLIDVDKIEKNENGYLTFDYQKIGVDYIHYYKSSFYFSDNKTLSKEMLFENHIRENNVGSYLTYHNSKQEFWSMFNKRNKTKEVKFGKGYVFIKNKDDDKIPFHLHKLKKVLTNNYYLTLNV